MPCSPKAVSVSAVVEKLQSSYLASVNACSDVKVQQYLLDTNWIQCGYGELLSSDLPTGRCQMEAAQASGATPNWFALAGSGKRSLWGSKGGARAEAVRALQRDLMSLST